MEFLSACIYFHLQQCIHDPKEYLCKNTTDQLIWEITKWVLLLFLKPLLLPNLLNFNIT